MLTKIKQFFNANLAIDEPQAATDPDQTIQLAAAALLFEVARADFDLGAPELQHIREALERQFDLDSGALQSLMALAEQEVDMAISLHQFTALVNEHYDQECKVRLIGAMWQVAFADGKLDKYEDHLIRKVADLIYVSHSDFIQQKLKAQSASEAPS